MTGGKQGARGFDGTRLRARRLSMGMTQRQVARELDVSESVVAHWERGAQRRPSNGSPRWPACWGSRRPT